MENGDSGEKRDAKVVIVTNLTRNVVEPHLRSIFGVYGEISKIDLPLFGKCASYSSLLSFFMLKPVYLSSWSKQRKSGFGVR
jgi:hypothetical protein